MDTEDPFNFADNAKGILEGTESPDLAAAWGEFPQITDTKQRDIVKFFLSHCDTYLKELIQRDDYSTQSHLHHNVSSLLTNLMFLYCEQFDPVKLGKLSEFKRFLANHDFDLLEILTNLKAIAVDLKVSFLLQKLLSFCGAKKHKLFTALLLLKIH